MITNTGSDLAEAELRPPGKACGVETQYLPRASSRSSGTIRLGRLLALAAVAFVCITAVSWLLWDHNADRQLRIEAQVRADVNELLKFPRDRSFRVSRAHFLFEDLNVLMRYRYSQQHQLGSIITELIANDCNFNDLRHLRFDSTALNHSGTYRSYLGTDTLKHELILHRYVDALRQLSHADPAYVRVIRFRRERLGPEDHFNYEERSRKASALILGFRQHLQIIQGPKTKKRWAISFITATGNPQLGEDLFPLILHYRQRGTLSHHLE